jgi:hypothetical protein
MVNYEKCQVLEPTSYQGEIIASYDDLYVAFGEPSENAPLREKVTCEWTGLLDGLPFTIYDWKTKIPYKDNKIWNIGGNTPYILGKVYSKFLMR